MTDIATIGEFGLIDRLTRNIRIEQPSTILGCGDDAAVIAYPIGQHTVVSTDLLLEGIHFDLTYTPIKHLGYKAAVVNFSDIAAMNARPRQIVVSIGLSSRFGLEQVDELYEGLRAACASYKVDLVGGDTTASLNGLTISITCIGEVEPRKLTKRSGAKPTDLICVSGNLGAAYMGLQLLEREKAVFESMEKTDYFQPAFEGREYLVERQLKPEARTDIVELLERENILPTSMIDISDGLSSELLHIAHSSKVGVRIYEERIPIDYQTALMAEEFNFNVVTAALNGGEDYELLFTAPLSMADKLQRLSDVHLIGHITESNLGCAMVSRDQQEITLQAQGWQAYSQQ
ncbi:MAG: thiamine-phosphate kinase [Porphyromonas sp.]|nr:thiamine-phosphate kinase [Porphyromonas sp.]